MPESQKSASKSVGRPFSRGVDSRRGRGPQPGAPNAGRPPDWIKAQLRTNRETAVEQVGELLEKKRIEPKLLLQLIKEFAPESDRQAGAKVTVSPDGTVTLDLGA